MRVYRYRLAHEQQQRLSLSISVDQQFWQEAGYTIAWVDEHDSINQTYQLIKRKQSRIHAADCGSMSCIPTAEWDKARSIADQLILQLSGRAYLWEEVQGWANQALELSDGDVLRSALQILYLQQKVEIGPGVTCGSWRFFARCNRCFARSSSLIRRPCASCGQKCMRCQHCLLLGRSRACTPFFCFMPSKQGGMHQVAMNLKHTLTAWQMHSVRRIEQFLTSSQRQLLFWAVTGAGKTECVAAGLKHYLQQGKRVLWVTPRKDVVLELAPRLKRIFPDLPLAALYGGSPDRHRDGQLVVATAHQAMRFYRAFDLAIVDEADAFPLYQNPMLTSVVLRALTSEARQIFLTATPPPNWQPTTQHQELGAHVLPIRPHGFPLPTPTIHLDRRLWKRIAKYDSQIVLSKFVERVRLTAGQAMLFVPRVQDVFLVQEWMHKCFPEQARTTTVVYAQDPEREDKITRFRHSQLQFLITTTILERGVTVPRSHVAVIGAEHLIFNRAALLQIAGRVGRSASYQQGEVWYISQERTMDQHQAVREIHRLNQSIVVNDLLL